ncbi:hypothetical protein AKO1_015416, partial [Acrasis kona]
MIEAVVLDDLAKNSPDTLKQVIEAREKIQPSDQYPFILPNFYVNLNNAASNLHFDVLDSRDVPGYVFVFKTKDCVGGDLILPQINARICMKQGEVSRVLFRSLLHQNNPITSGFRFSVIVPFHQRYLSFADKDKLNVLHHPSAYFYMKGIPRKELLTSATLLNSFNIHYVKGNEKSVCKRKGALQFAVIGDKFFKGSCQEPSKVMKKYIKHGVIIVNKEYLELFKVPNPCIEEILDKLGRMSKYHHNVALIHQGEPVLKKHKFSDMYNEFYDGNECDSSDASDGSDASDDGNKSESDE